MKRRTLLISAAIFPVVLVLGMAPGIASASSLPTVRALVPNHGSVNGGKKVTIIGGHLSGATMVDFGSTAANFTVESSQAITAVSPPGTGKVEVTVVTPSGTSTPVSTGSDIFTYTSQAPVVKKLVPNHGPEAGGTTVAIIGSHLAGATAVAFGANAGTIDSVNSAHAIIATSPPGTGSVEVTVTTPEGTSTPASAGSDLFTYVGNGPNVDKLAPKRGSVKGGTQVTIFGTGLSGATAVDFGSVPGTIVSVDSDNSMVVTSPPGTGTVDVTVTTPVGTSGTDSSDEFTYENSVPRVSLVIPGHGPAGGGTTVTIGGSDFRKVTAVDFGTTPAMYTVNSGHAITATSPGGDPGTVDITVTNANGTSSITSSDQFTYLSTPPSS